jgi:hypothetical protein
MRTAMLFLCALCFSLVAVATQSQGEEKPAPPTPPPARKIPAITAEDRYPGACVDCHINYTDMNMDTRLSTLMQAWYKEVDPRLLEKIRPAAPKGLELTGKHPDAADALREIPKGCLKCHYKNSKKAPPFAGMIHLIHLSGGEENHFLTLFQGECTHCHKLDVVTGKWFIPSSGEK